MHLWRCFCCRCVLFYNSVTTKRSSHITCPFSLHPIILRTLHCHQPLFFLNSSFFARTRQRNDLTEKAFERYPYLPFLHCHARQRWIFEQASLSIFHDVKWSTQNAIVKRSERENNQFKEAKYKTFKEITEVSLQGSFLHFTFPHYKERIPQWNTSSYLV